MRQLRPGGKALAAIASVEDLRRLARKKVPRAIFDYADGGACDEVTIQRNRRDLLALELRQRVMVDLSQLSLTSTMLGEPVTMPVALAPTGLTGLFHADGEIHAALAAERCGVPFALSTVSICSIEDVRAALEKPFWFQLYFMRDRGFSAELIARARAARCSALIVTVDLPIHGVRYKEIRNGLTIPPQLRLNNVFDVATKPAWALKVLFGKRRTFGNLEGRVTQTPGLKTLAQWIASQFDPAVTWKDIEWVRSHWPGKLIVKGILDAEDAREACAMGVDAIVVSNHGGRQLDGAPSSISVLPEIVQAVDGRCEVYMDGGVQSGQDVLKALALGARGCLIGKAFLYGLAAMGGAGVTKVLQIIRSQLAVSMALTGQTSVQSVSADVLRNPPEGVRRFSDHESLRVVRSDGDSGLRRPAP